LVVYAGKSILIANNLFWHFLAGLTLILMVMRIGRLLAFGCVVWAGTLAFAQQYPFIQIPGSPTDISSLFQDSKGRLWMIGSEIVCFDGARFFHLRDYGFPDENSNSITDDSSGAIWIGATSGVYRFSNGRVEAVAKGLAYSVISATPDVAIAAVGRTASDLSGGASLIRIQRRGSSWFDETIPSIQPHSSLTLDRSGMVLSQVTNNEWQEFKLQDVVRWKPGTLVSVTRHGSHDGGALNGPWQKLRDSSGCVWTSTPVGVRYHCGSEEHWAPYERAPLLGVREAPNGSLVLQGYALLAIGRPGSFQTASPANGLPWLSDAFPARDGTIWLSTSNGLARFSSAFHSEYWTTREGLTGPTWSIVRVGDKIFAGADQRIMTLSKDRVRWQTFAKFGEGGGVTTLLDGGDGTILAGFVSGGVVQLSPDGKVVAKALPGRPAAIMRLARTPDGEIWVGGKAFGRLVRDGSVLRFVEHALETQPVRNVLSIKYEEHTRKLWSCYGGGLVERDERGNWKEFTTRDGLLMNPCWSLAPRPHGDVWYAYFGRAFALVRPTLTGGIAVHQFGPNDATPDPAISSLDADRAGRLWRSGSQALYVADPAEAEAGNWVKIDQLDGPLDGGANSGSFFADTDGSIWFSNENSIGHYTPRADLVTPKFAPQIFLSAFSWENQPPKLAEAVGDMPHGSKIIAHIGSLQFDRRNALRLRYRLLPEQTSWRETANLDLALGALSAGQHTLEVQGRVFTGPWSAITRLRPLWLAWPLVALYFVSAATASSAGYLIYRRRKADAAQVLPDLTDWRLPALLPDVHDVAGKVLDARFEVGSLLARGGFASVLAGYDRSQKQPCAVKIFRTEVRDKDWVQKSFDQEVAALKKVRHPNVVSIYAHGRTPSGAPYLVMEFVEGKNLREVLNLGALTPQRVGRLLGQLAGALDAIHALEIWHRDVKPENVIVRNVGLESEQAVLIDFSIAIVKDANETLHGLSRAAGSFDYMAPEQAMGYAQPSSDVFSLAKVVLEMLTGKQLKTLLPYAALDLPDRVRELAAALNLGLSSESIEMLATALEFDPSRRPLTAKTFAGPLVRDLQSERSNRAL
jgi:tRNA A-37 threonylcarbamoyl transferase component Bud32/ligand-binding sensor domain-containing protein